MRDAIAAVVTVENRLRGQLDNMAMNAGLRERLKSSVSAQALVVMTAFVNREFDQQLRAYCTDKGVSGAEL